MQTLPPPRLQPPMLPPPLRMRQLGTGTVWMCWWVQLPWPLPWQGSRPSSYSALFFNVLDSTINWLGGAGGGERRTCFW